MRFNSHIIHHTNVVLSDELLTSIRNLLFCNQSHTVHISFTRRLKRWSFTRIASGAELDAYYHPNFTRDEPSRVKIMEYPGHEGSPAPLTDYDANTPSESIHQSPSTGEDDSAISPEEAGFRRMAWLALAPLYRDTSLMPTILDVASDNNNANVHDISKDSNSSNVDGADEEDVTFTGVKRRADTDYQNEDYAKPAAKRARNSNYDTKMNSGQQKKESSIVQEDDDDVSLPDWYEADDSEKQLLDEFQNEYLSKLEAIKYPYAMKEDIYWQERASSHEDDNSLPDWYEYDKDDDDYFLPDWYESSKSEEEQLSALAAKVSVTNEYDDIILTTKSQEESCNDSLPDWYAVEPLNDSNPTKQETNQQVQTHKMSTTREALFPHKLYNLLENSSTSSHDAIKWLPHGRAFRILDEHKFITVLAPKYFKQTKSRSFMRQLNLWGFIRCVIFTLSFHE